MTFMEAEVYEGNWIEVDGPDGWEYVEASMPVGEVPEYRNPGRSIGDGKTWAGYEYDWPAIDPPDILKEFLRNEKVWFLRIRDGWGAHLTAYGYLDQTDWSVFETEAEAWDYIHDSFCDDSGLGGDSYCNRPYWEVIVGNIGTVYRGCDGEYARRTFEEYKANYPEEESNLMIDGKNGYGFAETYLPPGGEEE